MRHHVLMTNLLTVSEVAAIANRSRSSVHRDIQEGKLTTAQKVSGYNGAYLVDEQAARDAYQVAEVTA